VVQMEFFFLNR